MAEFTRKLDQEIIPLLRKQKGFQDEITLVASNGTEAAGDAQKRVTVEPWRR